MKPPREKEFKGITVNQGGNMQRKYRFRITKSRAKQPFHYVCIANNNEIVHTSENYCHKAGALNAARKFISYMRQGVAVIEDKTGDSR